VAKRTGLGADTFFQSPEEPINPTPITELSLERSKGRKKPPAQNTVQTSVRLYEETLQAIDIVKLHERVQGNKLSVADVVDLAIKTLMEQKGIERPQASGNRA
jgi:hypothetical protein